jgi:hypothetical protein
MNSELSAHVVYSFAENETEDRWSTPASISTTPYGRTSVPLTSRNRGRDTIARRLARRKSQKNRACVRKRSHLFV